MTPEQYERFRGLIKKHSIHFDGPVEPRVWPSHHANIFLDIQKLGTALFKDYCESSVIDSLNKPWKANNRCRAARLCALAGRCLRENRNEAGWRMLLEPEVMARFTIEVACPNCRKRLWRSEIEVTLEDKDASPESLEQRRRTREPCTCLSVTRGEDHLEGGLNPLFSDRAQEVILHDALLQKVLPKREQPDRVYGLQSTRNFQKLLELISDPVELQFPNDHNAKDLKFSPFRQDGDPLLFPFLVLEAKSEKGQDNFNAIQMQTAFSIRTLLKMQADLQLATGEQLDCLEAPLVWFFASKGEQWRVSACYIANQGQTAHYHVIEIWRGAITHRDDSLRLLLIIDYIFDWARDLYRPTILRSLKTLAAQDTASLAGDSDIFSMADPVQSWLNQTELEKESVLEIRNENYGRIPPSLLALDSENGVIRHASFIQSRLQGLYITNDSVESLLLSFRMPVIAQRFARKLLQAMKHQSWRTPAHTLNALELNWTGHHRQPEESLEPQAMFYVTFALSAYMSPLWDQIREISYLAISEDAIDSLRQHAKCSRPGPRDVVSLLPEQHPIIGLPALEQFCDRVRSASIADNLGAAMSSALLEAITSNGSDCPRWQVETNMGSTLGFKSSMYSHGRTRHMFSTVYFENQIGRREPSEPFLRTSKRHDRQFQGTTSSFIWPMPQDLSTFGDGVLLTAYSEGYAKSKAPRWCFYMLNGPLETLDVCNISQLVQTAFSEQLGYRLTYQNSEKHRVQYNTPVDQLKDVWYDRKVVDGWLDHLSHMAKSTTPPKSHCPAQVPLASEDVQRARRPAASQISQRAAEYTAELVSSGSFEPLPAPAAGSRKRHSEAIDEIDDTGPQASKHQGKKCDSGFLTHGRGVAASARWPALC